MWIRSQGTFEEYRKIRQGYEIDNRKIFGEYAEDVIGVKERAGVKHNTIYEKLHKEKEMMEAKMLLPSLFLIPFLYRPANEQHPFGYTQIETLFIVIKGITMTAVTFGLIFNNINLMIHGGHIISFNTVAYFELFACVLGIIVTVYLYIKNKSMHSPLINMEMQGWRMDSVVSLGMACAFLLPICIPFAWFKNLVPYLDQIITVVLSLIMIPTPIRTVITGIRDLMLIPPEEETIEDIKSTVDTDNRYLRS